LLSNKLPHGSFARNRTRMGHKIYLQPVLCADVHPDNDGDTSSHFVTSRLDSRPGRQDSP
jgi:hypothetical protein